MIVSGYHLCNRSGVLQLQYPFLNNKYYIGLATNSNNGSSINPVGVTVVSNTTNKIYFVAEGSVTFTFIAIGDWK